MFLTASAVGFYGYDEGDRTFDESGPQGKGFLAEVTRVWETEANKLAGKRVGGVLWVGCGCWGRGGRLSEAQERP